MSYRLFILDEAMQFLIGMKKPERQRLREKLELIRSYPSNHVEYERRDAAGRRISGCIVGRHAIEYWEDTADMDVKVIYIGLADR
ncbi:MAG: hypothetical protein U1F81_20210 [Verrucomicrobiaceae bacterium]